MDETLDLQKEIIKKLALQKPNEEICGLILKDGSVFQCKNISNNKGVHYLIDPREIQSVQDNIYCTYHSHPYTTSIPSKEDELIAKKIGLSGLIFSLKDYSFCFYSPDNSPIPLLGRPFILGTLDCIELVRDYYKLNLNIEIPNKDFYDLRLLSFFEMPLSKYNTEENEGIMKDYFVSIGFSEVNNLMINDVLLFKEKNIIPACHAMIYIGNGQFIEQSSFSVSKIQTLKNMVKSGKIIKKAYCILRYSQ